MANACWGRGRVCKKFSLCGRNKRWTFFYFGFKNKYAHDVFEWSKRNIKLHGDKKESEAFKMLLNARVKCKQHNTVTCWRARVKAVYNINLSPVIQYYLDCCRLPHFTSCWYFYLHVNDFPSNAEYKDTGKAILYLSVVKIKQRNKKERTGGPRYGRHEGRPSRCTYVHTSSQRVSLEYYQVINECRMAWNYLLQKTLHSISRFCREN